MKLPQTDSIEKLAAFWDSHDVTDFEEELEEAVDPVFESKTVVKVPLDVKQAELAQQLAATKGITLPNLIQQWIVDRIQNL